MSMRWKLFGSSFKGCSSVKRFSRWSLFSLFQLRSFNTTKADVSKAYEVLGLSEQKLIGSDRLAEVKRAFLTKAKLAHPDAGGSNEAFHKLSIAFKRVLEDIERDGSATRREILQEMRKFEEERLKEKFKSYDASLAALFDLLRIKDDDDVNDNSRTSSGDGERNASSSSAKTEAREAGDNDALVDAGPLASALWKAYKGPQLDFSTLRREMKVRKNSGEEGERGGEACSAKVVVFPEEFEVELRSDASGSDSLLNLVYGRQQFGEVREDRAPLIDKEKFGDDDGNCKAKAAHAQTHRVSLFVTGERVATATYDGSEVIQIFIHATGSTVTILYKNEVLSSFFGKYEVNNNPNNDHDLHMHTVVKYWSPGVDHILWLTESPHNHVHTIHARKPYLPHSSYWMFPPRVSTHSMGGWYLRQNRRRQLKRNEPKTYSVEAFLLTLSIHHLLQELQWS